MAHCTFGISSLVSEAQQLDFIEYRTVLPLLPDDTMLRTIGEQRSRVASIRLETNDRMNFDANVLTSPKWEHFAHLLYTALGSKQVIVTLALSRSTVFSTVLFEQIRMTAELLYPVTIMIDATHRSWFRAETIELLDDADIPIVINDTPPLPGLTHPDPLAHASIGYVRLLGRNIREWCNPELRKRYEYRYERYELEQIYERVRTLCLVRDQIYVVAATTSPASALSAAQYLQHAMHSSNILLKR